jgi:hypothetical protein
VSGKREGKVMKEQCRYPYSDFSGKKFLEKYIVGIATLRKRIPSLDRSKVR